MSARSTCHGSVPTIARRLRGRVFCMRKTQTRIALDPDNASIMVCGGGGVAMHTARLLKDMGSWVWMMQRSDKNRDTIEKMMAFCVRGDALDKASVEKAVQSIDDLDAVVSSIGGTVKDPQADGEGNINIIRAAAARGVRKFVLVTSIGTGDSKDAPSAEVYKILEPVLIEKGKAEEELMAQDTMQWVIIRPGGLTDDPKTGKGFVTESKEVCGAISREDVASLVAKALFTDKLDGKVVSAVDVDRVTTSAPYETIPL